MDKNRSYLVPAYQREIKWKPNNAKTLVSDLVVSKKFLGYILLSTSNHSDYEIIDGQQRITVLLMIIHKLKQVLGETIGIGQLCPFRNESFPDFREALDNNFDFENQEGGFLQRDLLNQRDAMKELFDCVGVPRWAAHKVANTGNRIAHMCHNGWIQKAISNKRLAEFGLISMSDYYAERQVTC